MFSKQLVTYLLSQPKVIDGGTANINIQDETTRLYLKIPSDANYEFLVQIKSNKKKTFSISLHNQENKSKEGLIRIDYNSGHKNPEYINSFVPTIALPYQGYWFENESHMHIFVEGFKELAWAIPLSISTFKIKDISNDMEYENAIREFMNAINNTTQIQFQHSIV